VGVLPQSTVGEWSSTSSALKAVKGAKEAAVSLETHEALVKYDPEQVKVKDLIRAVKDARGMHAYDAKVKNK